MKIVSSVNNPIVKDILKLKDKKNRDDEGLFIVEGYHLVNEAYNAGLLKIVLSLNSDDLVKYDIEDKYLVNESIIKKISSTLNPQGIVGVSKVFNNSQNLLDLLKKPNLKIVILDDIADPGNMGTIIRTSAALGYDFIVSSLNSVDYYNEKTIRATQGALYKIPLFKENLVNFINLLKDNGILVYGCALYNSININEVKNDKKIALVFGNEAHGISNEILEITNSNIKIPMENDVESLNVSIAASIVMWNFKNK